MTYSERHLRHSFWRKVGSFSLGSLPISIMCKAAHVPCPTDQPSLCESKLKPAHGSVRDATAGITKIRDCFMDVPHIINLILTRAAATGVFPVHHQSYFSDLEAETIVMLYAEEREHRCITYVSPKKAAHSRYFLTSSGSSLMWSTRKERSAGSETPWLAMLPSMAIIS